MSAAGEGVTRAFVPSQDVAPDTMAIVRERSTGEVVDLAQLLREALPTAIDASEDGKGGTRSMLGRAVVLLLATCDEQRQSFDRSISARQEVDRLQQSKLAELQARVSKLEADLVGLQKRYAETKAAFDEAAPDALRALHKRQVDAQSLDATLGAEVAEKIRAALRRKPPEPPDDAVGEVDCDCDPDPGAAERARIAISFRVAGTVCEVCKEKPATRRGIDAQSMLRAMCDGCAASAPKGGA